MRISARITRLQFTAAIAFRRRRFDQTVPERGEKEPRSRGLVPFLFRNAGPNVVLALLCMGHLLLQMGKLRRRLPGHPFATPFHHDDLLDG